jgi:hypothetical protein
MAGRKYSNQGSVRVVKDGKTDKAATRRLQNNNFQSAVSQDIHSAKNTPRGVALKASALAIEGVADAVGAMGSEGAKRHSRSMRHGRKAAKIIKSRK